MDGSLNYANMQYLQPNTGMLTQQNGQMLINQTPSRTPTGYMIPSQQIPPLQQLQYQNQTLPPTQMQFIPNNFQSNGQKSTSTTTTSNDWQTITYKKRYRSPEENQKRQKQTKLDEYWLGNTTSSNIFNNLQEEGDNTPSATMSKNTEPKPPPIFIAGVSNINPLTQLLKEIAGEEFILKALGDEQVKIQPKTGETYTKITKALIQKNTQFHTYQSKQQRCFRVALKNLHPSTDVEEIKNNIQLLGHEVVRVWNVTQNRTKKPLPLFFVDLTPKDNNKDIYQTKLFMNTSVTFEAPHAKRIIPQCSRCQRFGHTKNFCQRIPRCVKCTNTHLTADCPRKLKDDSVKCVNCNQNHPANYRGCIIHKQLQQKLYPKLREKTLPTSIINQAQVIPGVSYAQVTRPPNSTNEQIQPTNDLSELKLMMKELITQMGTMMNLITTLVNKMA